MQEKREKSAVFGAIFMKPTSNAGIKEERAGLKSAEFFPSDDLLRCALCSQ